ncbi:MAG: proline racemase family protein [Planctomycetota bacterium]
MAFVSIVVGNVARTELIEYIDTHTEGEPTRLIIRGGPDLGPGSLSDRLNVFRNKSDDFRRSVLLEPRGTEAMVGALLCEPEDSSCVAGVIFINNEGYLGMCGHGAIGVAVSLYHLGRIGLGKHRLETPVGVIEFDLRSPHSVEIENVPSYRYKQDVAIQTKSFGRVIGDIAWGGNWFFISDSISVELTLKNLETLMKASFEIRGTLEEQGISGANNALIDHIELTGKPVSTDASARNFVLCPGGQYDRSPCGTGTSAKIACLAAEGLLNEGDIWVQESVIGSRFLASYKIPEAFNRDEALANKIVIPRISGRAFVCGEGRLVRHHDDPFRNGITNENET